MDRELEKRPVRRYSFILSLWAESSPFPQDQPVWRISLEDPHLSVRRGFKDLGDLARFLEEWTAGPPEESPVEP